MASLAFGGPPNTFYSNGLTQKRKGLRAPAGTSSPKEPQYQSQGKNQRQEYDPRRAKMPKKEPELHDPGVLRDDQQRQKPQENA